MNWQNKVEFIVNIGIIIMFLIVIFSFFKEKYKTYKKTEEFNSMYKQSQSIKTLLNRYKKPKKVLTKLFKELLYLFALYDIFKHCYDVIIIFFKYFFNVEIFTFVDELSFFMVKFIFYYFPICLICSN